MCLIGLLLIDLELDHDLLGFDSGGLQFWLHLDEHDLHLPDCGVCGDELIQPTLEAVDGEDEIVLLFAVDGLEECEQFKEAGGCDVVIPP